MATITSYVQGIDKGWFETINYEDVQNLLEGANVIDVNISDNLIAITYELNGKQDVLFTTHLHLLAACKYVVSTYFKNPLESLSDSHTSHKTLC